MSENYSVGNVIDLSHEELSTFNYDVCYIMSHTVVERIFQDMASQIKNDPSGRRAMDATFLMMSIYLFDYVGTVLGRRGADVSQMQTDIGIDLTDDHTKIEEGRSHSHSMNFRVNRTDKEIKRRSFERSYLQGAFNVGLPLGAKAHVLETDTGEQHVFDVSPELLYYQDYDDVNIFDYSAQERAHALHYAIVRMMKSETVDQSFISFDICRAVERMAITSSGYYKEFSLAVKDPVVVETMSGCATLSLKQYKKFSKNIYPALRKS